MKRDRKDIHSIRRLPFVGAMQSSFIEVTIYIGIAVAICWQRMDIILLHIKEGLSAVQLLFDDLQFFPRGPVGFQQATPYL